MARWLRDLFPTRRRPPAPAAPEPAAPSPEPPPPTLWTRVLFWRAELRREAEQAPSVDQVQQQDAQEQRRRLDAGSDRIARSIAKRGAWFPWDD